MIGRLRQLSDPRLRQQAGIEKSQTPVERDILVQWVRKELSVQVKHVDSFIRYARKNFPAPLKIEKTLSHR